MCVGRKMRVFLCMHMCVCMYCKQVMCIASKASVKSHALWICIPHFRGLFISIKDAGHIYEMICNWPERNVKVISNMHSNSLLFLLSSSTFPHLSYPSLTPSCAFFLSFSSPPPPQTDIVICSFLC